MDSIVYLRLRERHVDYAAEHIQHMQKALTEPRWCAHAFSNHRRQPANFTRQHQ
jgi:hypothetical protein